MHIKIFAVGGRHRQSLKIGLVVGVQTVAGPVDRLPRPFIHRFARFIYGVVVIALDHNGTPLVKWPHRLDHLLRVWAIPHKIPKEHKLVGTEILRALKTSQQRELVCMNIREQGYQHDCRGCLANRRHQGY